MSLVMDIREDDLTGPEIAALLAEHLADMHQHTPPDSVHAMDLSALRAAGVNFWCAWDGRSLMGCGALKRLDTSWGEIKSMRTADTHRRKGVAEAMLVHIIDFARANGIKKLSLETGSMAVFEPARRLYEKHGFEYCGPFGDYSEDRNSVFMTLAL